MSQAEKYEGLTVSTTVVPLAAVPKQGCTKWLVTVEAVVASCIGVRFTADGSVPSGTVGHLLPAQQSFVFDFEPSRCQFIRDSAATTDAKVHVHYLAD